MQGIAARAAPRTHGQSHAVGQRDVSESAAVPNVQRELPREKLELFLGRFRAGVNGLNNNVFQALKLQPFNREDSDRVRDYREGLLAHQQLMHNLAVV